MKDFIFLQRCLDIARLGHGTTSPNPSVGAVLVHENRIIGEGWTSPFGGAHAEVNAINSVQSANKALIKQATLYVSLEPCHHWGKTPPCVDLVLSEQISKVVIGCKDPNPLVAGKSVNKLLSKGVEVVCELLSSKTQSSMRSFLINIKQNRPYVILKYAMSQDKYISKKGEQTWLTNAYSKRLTHRWRSEIDAILIGTNTAAIDNPQLNNRLWYGKSPKRIVFDRQLRLPKQLHLFDGTQQTYIITEKMPHDAATLPNVMYLVLKFDETLLPTLLERLYKEAQIGILMVEGGTATLQQFIDAELWDEARVLVAPKQLHEGVAAPTLKNASEPVLPVTIGTKNADMLYFFNKCSAE
ncbi:MAG: hypothetical protein RLZZ292_2554 [Bacteroidota bacterium]|jgi:diaminohydroxyphosphoribosylaminopyrimidine deaminase/5-amino-6-(5-phosphoribosylamino)uracil reductase